MFSTDREAFERELAVLFGGFPTFLTAPRIDAYWRGLQKMQLSMFVRCVDAALQDQSEEGKKLPTVNRVWELSRTLKARTAMPPRETQTNFDDYHQLGQRWLLAFLIQNEVELDKLPKLIEAKNRIVTEFRADGRIELKTIVKEWLDVATATFEREAA